MFLITELIALLSVNLILMQALGTSTIFIAADRGTLIRVLQRYSQRLEGSFLYYPHRNVSPALRAVIDTLRM